ncbi:unnamed protein product [Arctogadus glacialis]
MEQATLCGGGRGKMAGGGVALTHQMTTPPGQRSLSKRRPGFTGGCGQGSVTMATPVSQEGEAGVSCALLWPH